MKLVNNHSNSVMQTYKHLQHFISFFKRVSYMFWFYIPPSPVLSDPFSISIPLNTPGSLLLNWNLKKKSHCKKTLRAVILSFNLTYYTVLVRVSIAVMEHHDQKQLGKESLFSLHILREARTGTRARPKTEGRSWYRGHESVLLTGLLRVVCSACFLIEPRTTAKGWNHPPWATPSPISY